MRQRPPSSAPIQPLFQSLPGEGKTPCCLPAGCSPPPVEHTFVRHVQPPLVPSSHISVHPLYFRVLLLHLCWFSLPVGHLCYCAYVAGDDETWRALTQYGRCASHGLCFVTGDNLFPSGCSLLSCQCSLKTLRCLCFLLTVPF